MRFSRDDLVRYVRKQWDLETDQAPLGTEARVLRYVEPKDRFHPSYVYTVLFPSGCVWFVDECCIEPLRDELDDLAEAFN